LFKNAQTSLLRNQITLLNAHAATKLLSDLTQNLGIWAGKKYRNQTGGQLQLIPFMLLQYLVKYAQLY